jgi:hypothetical protein
MGTTGQTWAIVCVWLLGRGVRPLPEVRADYVLTAVPRGPAWRRQFCAILRQRIAICRSSVASGAGNG